MYFEVVLINTVEQEPIFILAKSYEEVLEVQKIAPEHHVVSKIQNIGPCEDASDYIKRMKEGN